MFSGQCVTPSFVFIHIPASNVFFLTSFLQYPLQILPKALIRRHIRRNSRSFIGNDPLSALIPHSPPTASRTPIPNPESRVPFYGASKQYPHEYVTITRLCKYYCEPSLQHLQDKQHVHAKRRAHALHAHGNHCCPIWVESVGMEGALPPALRKGFAFPADLPSFLLIRAAAKALPSAARMRLVSSPRRRKGAAFPQSKRRSRRSVLNSRIVIWT